MAQLVAVLVPFILLGFWAWMFWDLTNKDNLPGCFITVSGGSNPRLDWNVAFILLNIIAAGYYYLNVYRYRH